MANKGGGERGIIVDGVQHVVQMPSWVRARRLCCIIGRASRELTRLQLVARGGLLGRENATGPPCDLLHILRGLLQESAGWLEGPDHVLAVGREEHDIWVVWQAQLHSK